MGAVTDRYPGLGELPKPIEGLYAAGELTGMILGTSAQVGMLPSLISSPSDIVAGKMVSK